MTAPRPDVRSQSPDTAHSWTGPDAEEWAEIHALRMQAYRLKDQGRGEEAQDLLREAEVRRQLVAERPLRLTDTKPFPPPGRVVVEVERKGHAHPLLFQLADLED